jgi:hypothetical protein
MRPSPSFALDSHFHAGSILAACVGTETACMIEGWYDISAPQLGDGTMKRLALVAAVMLVAACASGEEAATTDTGAAMTPPPADTAMMSDTTMMHDTGMMQSDTTTPTTP